MLLKKTYIKESSIKGAGLGLFAAEPIKKGEVLWVCEEFSMLTWSQKEWDALPEVFRQWATTYVYKHGWDGHYKLIVDDSRFLNHSDDPNTESYEDVHATRDIAKDEEILCDYREFCTEDWFRLQLPTVPYHKKK
jgi:SET domain-containing protein